MWQRQKLRSNIQVGRQALATELSIVQDDFEVYDIRPAPTTIAFHLREFNVSSCIVSLLYPHPFLSFQAAVAFAESSSLPLDLHFTQPAEPLFITAEPDSCDVLFVISTFQVRGEVEAEMGKQTLNAEATMNSGRSKRPRADEGTSTTGVIRKSVKVVERADRSHVSEAGDSHISNVRSSSVFRPDVSNGSRSGTAQEPLFLPQSQLSFMGNADTLRESGLGIENMDEEELAAMLEDDGEEVNAGIGSQMPPLPAVNPNRLQHEPEHENGDRGQDWQNGVELEGQHGDMGGESLEDSLDIVDDDMEFGPTQLPARQDTRKVCSIFLDQRAVLTSLHPFQTFRPLFDD